MAAYRHLTLSLGLVTVPITIDPRTQSTRPSGSRHCPTDHAKMQQVLVCSECGQTHAAADCVTLYDGAALNDPPSPAEKSSAVALEAFMTSAAIPLEAVEKSYDCRPGKGGDAGFMTLHAAMRRAGVLAVGRVTLDKAPQQVAVEAVESGMRLHLLRYSDAFRASDPVELPAPSEPEVKVALALIEAHRAEALTPLPDSYAAAMRAGLGEGEGERFVPGDGTKIEQQLRESVALVQAERAKPKRSSAKRKSTKPRGKVAA